MHVLWAGTGCQRPERAPVTKIYLGPKASVLTTCTSPISVTLESGFFIVKSFYSLDAFSDGNWRIRKWYGRIQLTGYTAHQQQVQVQVQVGGNARDLLLHGTGDTTLVNIIWPHIRSGGHIWAYISYMINWFLYKCMYVSIYKGIWTYMLTYINKYMSYITHTW